MRMLPLMLFLPQTMIANLCHNRNKHSLENNY